MEEMRNAQNIFGGNTEGKRSLERLKRKWEDIRVNLKEIGWEGVDWMHLVQKRDQWWDLVNTVMCVPVPNRAGNFLLV
jgi:hypothetical protein